MFIHGILLKTQSVTYIVFLFLFLLNQSMVCFRDKDRTVVYYQLLGGKHDVNPPVVGIDCAGVVVRRPGELSHPNSAP